MCFISIRNFKALLLEYLNIKQSDVEFLVQKGGIKLLIYNSSQGSK